MILLKTRCPDPDCGREYKDIHVEPADRERGLPQEIYYQCVMGHCWTEKGED